MGTRSWLSELINTTYLPEIAQLQDSSQGRAEVQQLAISLRQDWVERGFTTLERQQGLMDQTRRMLKDQLGDDHFSLELIRFTTAEYTQINQLKQRRVAHRNESVQFLDDPDAIVSQAVHLLESPEWATIAAGLSVLTGRRSSELLSTARFEPTSKWSVRFTGALKRREETQTLEFEIPTLTTAQRVCTALERIRQALPEAVQLPAATVSRSYGQAVIRACDQAFASLVPRREGKDSLYTHLFRSIYATIATFWYCPPRVNATEFKAAIQGHYAILGEQNPELRRSLAASRHYSDYEIADRVIAQYNGQRQGVKLGFGGVEPISVFRQSWVIQQEQVTECTEPGRSLDLATGRKLTTSIRVWQEDKTRLLTLLTQIGAAEGRQQDRLSHLLNWVEQQLHREATLAQMPPPHVSADSIEVGQPDEIPEPSAQEVIAEPINSSLSETATPPEQGQSKLLMPEVAPIVETTTIPEATQQVEAPLPVAPVTLDPNVVALLAGMTQLTEQVGQLVLSLTPKDLELAAPIKEDKPQSAVQEIAEIATPSIDTPILDTPSVDISSVDRPVATPTEAIVASSRLRRSKSETDDILERAIQAIMDWNNTSDRRHDDKWAITINTLKSFTKSQRKIEGVLLKRQQEIAQHHAEHDIDPRKHNLRHRRKAAIEQLIKL